MKLVLLLIPACIVMQGCNLFGGIDEAKSRDELVADALAKMDNGECTEAVTKLNAIGDKDDRVYQALGWAHLCTAGATINKIGATLFNYNTTSNNLSIVGDLAAKLIPSTSDTVTKVANAVTSFGLMSSGSEKQLSQALSNIIKAAAVIAQSTSDNVKVTRRNVAPSATCDSATCSTSPAACAGGMSDTNADLVSSALIAASAAVGSASSLGAIKDLAERLGTDVSTSNAARCSVVQTMLSQ